MHRPSSSSLNPFLRRCRSCASSRGGIHPRPTSFAGEADGETRGGLPPGPARRCGGVRDDDRAWKKRSGGRLRWSGGGCCGGSRPRRSPSGGRHDPAVLSQCRRGEGPRGTAVLWGAGRGEGCAHGAGGCRRRRCCCGGRDRICLIPSDKKKDRNRHTSRLRRPDGVGRNSRAGSRRSSDLYSCWPPKIFPTSKRKMMKI